MNKERKQELVNTLGVQTTSYNTKNMNAFIKREAAKVEGCKLKMHKGNIYITKGNADTYPCIVAHTDTVHKLYPNFSMFENDGKLFSINSDTMKRVGIGGDDKVGVFVALQVLKEIDVCKVAFFRDEEVGCVGSKAADMKFFDNTEFVLQCDRKGAKDFVNEISWLEMYNESFSEAISTILKTYGRQEVDGGMTDVLQLANNGLDVCCANMSCGYYLPHTDNEYVVIDEVNDTLDMVLEIFETVSGVVWKIDRKKKVYTPTTYYGGFSTDKQCSECMGYDTFHEDIFGLWCNTCVDYTGVAEAADEEEETDVEGDCSNCGMDGGLVTDDTLCGGTYCHNCQTYLDKEGEKGVWIMGEDKKWKWKSLSNGTKKTNKPM
tara:strand:- start:2326 stop:3456 length:1131 start_codon:yes stop_codon:yes gene_type:complete